LGRGRAPDRPEVLEAHSGAAKSANDVSCAAQEASRNSAVARPTARPAPLEGFRHRADVAVPAPRRDRLERLCRDLFRPRTRLLVPGHPRSQLAAVSLPVPRLPRANDAEIADDEGAPGGALCVTLRSPGSGQPACFRPNSATFSARSTFISDW
jgi:hypothetical protein